MSQKIFVNLPVQDLAYSRSFFKALGFSINEHFSDDTAACVVISDTIYVMLLTYPKFKAFTPHRICDAKQSTEVLVCLSCESREKVDALVGAAINAGGSLYSDPQDHGFMYGHGFQDPDGHIWELMWMDPNATPQG